MSETDGLDCLQLKQNAAVQHKQTRVLTESGILLEVQVLEGEMRFHDAGGLHSGPQHILLCGDVIGLGYPLQVIQVADGNVGKKRVMMLNRERCLVMSRTAR